MAAEPPGGRPSVLFRLQGGGGVGWGHLTRCAALAAELRQRGWHCRLWGNPLPADSPNDAAMAFESRLMDRERPEADWIVVDDYGVTDELLREWRKSRACGGARVLVIDDECRRSLASADLVVNPRLGMRESAYARGPSVLTGENYALLRPGLGTPTPIHAAFEDPAEPVLVTLGGTDPRGWTAGVLHGLADACGSEIAPVVVRSKGGADAALIREGLRRFRQSAWVEQIDAATLAGWACRCRWAVSGAGGTLLELAFLRLRFVSVVVAGNQEALAREAADRWGMPCATGEDDIRSAVADAVRRLPSAVRFDPPIDGRGAARVADAMADQLAEAR